MNFLFEQFFGEAARLTQGAYLQPGPALSRASGPAKALRGAPYATFEESTFDAASGSREFKLFVPAGYAERGLPLIVMLHGCGQSPDDFAAGTRMNEVAQERGFLVLYPAQAPRSNSSKCWNWFMPGDQRRGSGECELLAAMTRQIVTTHGIDPKRVYAAGLSAGGAMADILGREYPDVFAAVGVHSGVRQGVAHDMSSAFAVMRSGSTGAGLPVTPSGALATPQKRPRKGARLNGRHAATIVFHGDRDSTVHPSNGDELITAVLGAAGRPEQVVVTREKKSHAGRAVTRTVHRRQSPAADEPSLAEHWSLHGAGHAWSGGSTKGSYTDATGPDATREMVRFFEEHPMRSNG